MLGPCMLGQVGGSGEGGERANKLWCASAYERAAVGMSKVGKVSH